jgi:protein involved in polysaccharide export with SLBB domain
MRTHTERVTRSPVSAGLTSLCVMAMLGLTACSPVLKQGTPLGQVLEEDMLASVGPYRLQQGDQLEVHHILDADYSAIVIVAPDGMISVPGIAEPIEAKGHTISELTNTLNGLYKQAQVFNKPYFSLNLRSFGSLQVFVGGEVQRPGYLELVGGDRYIMQVLTSGGGFLPTARQSEVIVLRTKPDGKPQIFSVNVRHILDGTDLSQNVRIHPMDVVFVPKSDIAVWDQWVDQYVRQALPLQTSGGIEYVNQYGNSTNNSTATTTPGAVK